LYATHTYHSVSKSGEQTPEITTVANTNPSPIVLTMSGTVLPKEEKEDEEKDGKEEKQQIEDNPLDTPASVDTIK